MARGGSITESTIQSAVWQVELGRGKTVVTWVLLALLALALALVYTAVEFRGLEKREAIDQAQLARNLAQGRGYTTHVIRPLSIWHLQTKAGWDRADPRLVMSHPELENPPLYPWMISHLFRLLPEEVFEAQPEDTIHVPERWVILPFNQVCLLLSILLVYFWARQLFDHRVAITTGLLLLFSDQLWGYGVSGLNTNFAMLLVLVTFYLLYRVDRGLVQAAAGTEDDAPPAEPATVNYVLILASAVFLALCFLTRYMLGLLLVPALFYLNRIMAGRRARLWIAVYAGLFLLLVAPWLVRNYNLAGNPLGIAQYEWLEDGGPFSGDSLQRSYDPTTDGRLSEAYSAEPRVARFLSGLRCHGFSTFFDLGNGFLPFFFGVGLMYGFRRAEVSRLRQILVGGFLVLLCGMSLLGARPENHQFRVYGDNLFVLLFPIMAMFSVAFFYLLLDRIPFRIRLTHGLVIGLFVALNVGSLVLTVLPPRRARFPYPPYIPPVVHSVSAWFGPDEVGCSDLPWAMAWQGNQRTVWLPMTIADFYEIHDFIAPDGIAFLMFTPYMLDRPLITGLFRGEYQGWSSVIRGRLPKQFPLKAATTLPPGQQQYLFADSARWKGQPVPDPMPPEPGQDDAGEVRPGTGGE